MRRAFDLLIGSASIHRIRFQARARRSRSSEESSDYCPVQEEPHPSDFPHPNPFLGRGEPGDAHCEGEGKNLHQCVARATLSATARPAMRLESLSELHPIDAKDVPSSRNGAFT